MRLTIRDLEQRSGLSRRTIHYYSHEGLLPSARGVGPGATYGEEHLLRLQLIPVLKHAGLRLERIGCALETMSRVQMRRLLEMARDAEIEDPHQLARWLASGCGDTATPVPTADSRPQVEAVASDSSQWVRYRVSPRLEIHYCPGDSAATDLESKLRQLSDMAEELFGSEGSDE